MTRKEILYHELTYDPYVEEHYGAASRDRMTALRKSLAAVVKGRAVRVVQKGAKSMTTKFEIGKTYSTRSLCDYDTIFRFEIVSRTAKQMTYRNRFCGDIKRRGIYVYAGVEQCKPFGTYSMCPVIRA